MNSQDINYNLFIKVAKKKKKHVQGNEMKINFEDFFELECKFDAFCVGYTNTINE